MEVRARGLRRHGVAGAGSSTTAPAVPEQVWPFTRSGGVDFAAGDDYGEGVRWWMRPAATGKTVEWGMLAKVWVTYNYKKRTLHTQTSVLEFKETLRLTVAELGLPTISLRSELSHGSRAQKITS